MEFKFTQWQNLPTELAKKERFSAAIILPNGDKRACTKRDAKPENYTFAEDAFKTAKHYGNELGNAFAALDLCGHGKGDNYVLFDFDHVLDDQGNIVNPDAEKWLNYFLMMFEDCYAELSTSGTGIHFLGKPTQGKFGKLTGKDGESILWFDRDKNKKIKLEIFYFPDSRKTCHMTGELFHCEAGAPIADSDVTDDVLTQLLNCIAPPKLKPAATETPRAELPADIQALVHRINNITHEQLLAKGYLQRSEKGAPHPTGYICLWCGSGTHKNKTGALNFYTEENNNHVHCHAHGCHGDIVALLAKHYGKEPKGKEFFEVLRQAADDFGIEYDPKIFERHAPMKAKQEGDTFVWTQDRIADCPVNLRLPDDYTFGTDGIYLVVETKKGNKYICAARTPILPTEKFREPIKGTLEYKFAILDGGKWRTVEIDGGALADTRELTKTLSRHGAQIKKSETLREFLVDILSLNPGLKEIKTYNRTGWHDGKFIYPTGGADYIVRRPGFDFAGIFKPKGNAELWKQKFKEVMRQGGAQARVFCGVALSAPLAEPIIEANPSAHLHGKSGGGKTALQKLIASIFGNPRELMRTFAATNKNRLLVADAFNGLPTFFDELETVQGKAAEEALSTDVYNFYDGTGNQANKRNGDAREMFKFRAARLSTGERRCLKQHDLRGAYKRLLELEAKAKFLPDELAADLHFFTKSNHGLFGGAWVNFVSNHLEEIQKEYEYFAKFYAPQKKYEPTHLKTLAAAVVSFEFFSVAIGIKNEFDKCACIRDMRAIVDTLPTTQELDDTTRAIEDLSSYVSSHVKAFNRPVKDPETKKVHEVVAWGTTTLGRIYENGEVAFLPTELRRILEDELHFASADKLLREWKEQGNILITDKDRLTHKTPIGDTRPRANHFKARILVTCPDDEELIYYEEKGVV